MNEQTEKLIREFAEKMGTTAEHLWAVVIAQSAVGAWAQILSFVIWIAILAPVWLATIGELKLEIENGKMTPKTIAFYLSSIGLVMWVIILTSQIPWLVTRFVNPEYWALQRVTELF